jgi:hypothetical protein
MRRGGGSSVLADDRQVGAALGELVRDPLWAARPVWVLTLIELSRRAGADAEGAEGAGRSTSSSSSSSNADTSDAMAVLQRWLSLEQERHAGGYEGWLRSARLVSLNARGLFPENGGAWDCVLLMEYASPAAYAAWRAARGPGEEDMHGAAHKLAILAVRPSLLCNEPNAMPAHAMAASLRAADAHHEAQWRGRAWAQSGAEEQRIWPDPARVVGLFAEDAPLPRASPLLALNLLAYRRSPLEPRGRALYQQYIQSITRIVDTRIAGRRGVRCVVTPVRTLTGGLAWDDLAIMEYPDLTSFLGLSSQPGYDNDGARKQGLLYQELVLMEPQLCNGVVEGPFSLGDGNWKGLASPSPLPDGADYARL